METNAVNNYQAGRRAGNPGTRGLDRLDLIKHLWNNEYVDKRQIDRVFLIKIDRPCSPISTAHKQFFKDLLVLEESTDLSDDLLACGKARFNISHMKQRSFDVGLALTGGSELKLGQVRHEFLDVGLALGSRGLGLELGDDRGDLFFALGCTGELFDLLNASSDGSGSFSEEGSPLVLVHDSIGNSHHGNFHSPALSAAMFSFTIAIIS